MLTKNVLKRLRKRFESVMDLVEFPFDTYSLGADGIVVLDEYENASYEDSRNVILRALAQSTLGRLYGLSCRLHLENTVVLMTHDLRSATISFPDLVAAIGRVRDRVAPYAPLRQADVVFSSI